MFKMTYIRLSFCKRGKWFSAYFDSLNKALDVKNKLLKAGYTVSMIEYN